MTDATAFCQAPIPTPLVLRIRMSVQESCRKQRLPGGLPAGWSVAVKWSPLGAGLTVWSARPHTPPVPLCQGTLVEEGPTACLPLLEESLKKSGHLTLETALPSVPWVCTHRVSQLFLCA